MKTKTLVERIENFLRSKGEWICGGEIQKLAAGIGFEPQNAGRRLRELTNDGILEVEYRKGNNKRDVAWYRYVFKEKIVSKYQVIDGKVVLTQEKVLA